MVPYMYFRATILDPRLPRQLVAAMWGLIDPSNTGSVVLAALHEFLGTKFGKDKSFKPVSVVDRVLSKIRERTGTTAGMAGLRR